MEISRFNMAKSINIAKAHLLKVLRLTKEELALLKIEYDMPVRLDGECNLLGLILSNDHHEYEIIKHSHINLDILDLYLLQINMVRSPFTSISIDNLVILVFIDRMLLQARYETAKGELEGLVRSGMSELREVVDAIDSKLMSE